MKKYIFTIIIFFLSFFLLNNIFFAGSATSLIISIILSLIFALFISTNYLEIRRLQKQADSLGWEFITLQKNGKYRDYIYRKENVLATLSYKYKKITIYGEVYKDFYAIEKDFKKQVDHSNQMIKQMNYGKLNPESIAKKSIQEHIENYTTKVIDILSKSLNEEEILVITNNEILSDEIREFIWTRFFLFETPLSTSILIINVVKSKDGDVLQKIKQLKNFSEEKLKKRKLDLEK